MSRNLILVDGYAPVPHLVPENVREEVWAYAMDQRAFGPRRLWVVFADADGTFRGLAYTRRTKPWQDGFDACLHYLGEGAAAALVLNDEAVSSRVPVEKLELRLAEARVIALPFGIHVVDWIACDDDQFRAARMRTMKPAEEAGWWDVPTATGR